MSEGGEVRVEELKQYRIFLGTPMYGGQCSGLFTKSVADLTTLCSQQGIYINQYFLFNESLVQRARNYITDEFLRSDCTHLLFIDSDIGFDARDVLNLLAIQHSNPDTVHVISGAYPKKTIAWEKVQVASRLGKGDNSPFDLENYSADFALNLSKMGADDMMRPVQVAEAATGFMLLPRTTLEKWAERYPEQRYRPDHARTENFDGSNEITAFFDCVIDPETKRYLSEDYYFCKKAREAGMFLWMCPWMKLNHVGMHVFRGDMRAMHELGLSVTADKSSLKRKYRKPKRK
jgi:hypothetical protein